MPGGFECRAKHSFTGGIVAVLSKNVSLHPRILGTILIEKPLVVFTSLRHPTRMVCHDAKRVWSVMTSRLLPKNCTACPPGSVPADTQRTKASPGAAPRALGLTLWKECLVLFLRNADGGPLFDSFVHLLGGEQRPDRHASEPRGICTQLGGGCGDFIGVIDNRVGGGRAVIEIPKFELASDRLDKLGDTCLEGRGRLLF